MKHQVFFGIAIRIFILFTVGSLMTFIPEHLRDFFGDVKFIPYYETLSDGSKYLIERPYGSSMDDEWIWGTRHYWYFWMMVFLFLLSLVNVIIGCNKLINKHYPNTF